MLALLQDAKGAADEYDYDDDFIDDSEEIDILQRTAKMPKQQEFRIKQVSQVAHMPDNTSHGKVTWAWCLHAGGS